MTPRKGRRQFLEARSGHRRIGRRRDSFRGRRALGAEVRPAWKHFARMANARILSIPSASAASASGRRHHKRSRLRIQDAAAGFSRDGHARFAAFHFVARLRSARYRPAQHRLLIHGMVDRPLIFTVEELRRLPSVSRFHFLECHGNQRRFRPHGHSEKSAERDRAGNARPHQLQRMDRRTAFPAAERSRRAKRRDLDRGRRRGHRQAHEEHSDGKGDGRCPGRLRAEWRAAAPRAGLSAAPGGARMAGHP